MRRGQELSAPDVEEEINITPLIDVVFIVLITFILVAPLFELDRIQLADGAVEVERPMAKESNSIILEVRSDDTILLNKKLVAIEQLGQFLFEEKKKNPDVTPQLFQDKKAHFGTYQSVKNAVEGAGFSEMDVLLKPAGG